jgi:hypothetical protein
MAENAVAASLTILFVSLLAACRGEHAHPGAIAFQQGNATRGEYLSKVFSCQDCHTIRESDGMHLNRSLLLAGGVPLPGRDGSLVCSSNVTICYLVCASL